MTLQALGLFCSSSDLNHANFLNQPIAEEYKLDMWKSPEFAAVAPICCQTHKIQDATSFYMPISCCITGPKVAIL